MRTEQEMSVGREGRGEERRKAASGSREEEEGGDG